MGEIGINESWGSEHDKALDRDNYNVSRTHEDATNYTRYMHHIHNSCEFLLVEGGAAYYYIDGQPHYAEKGDILVIGAMYHHRRAIELLPFQRYGLTVKPSYYKSLMLENDLLRIFETPSVEQYNRHYKNIDPKVFDSLVMLLQALKEEQRQGYNAFRPQMERALITQIAVILFRTFGLKQDNTPLLPAHIHMLEIKEYIDLHFQERLNLKMLSEKFFLHSTTISKDFHKYCGHSLNKYINMVRISEAAKLLENTNNSIALIAEKCGYDSDNTFLRQFKSLMEISPSQYRKTIFEMRGKLWSPSLEKQSGAREETKKDGNSPKFIG